VPAASRNLLTVVQRWADKNALLGCACDVSTRRGYVTAYLGRPPPDGLVLADLPGFRQP
jgi:hypothetical protein